MPQVAQNPIREYLDPELWDKYFDWFVYGVRWNPLAASSPRTDQSFNVDIDSHFLVLATVGQVADNPPTTLDATPTVLVEIQDTGAGANWFNGQQLFYNVFGSQLSGNIPPNACEVPRFVAGGSTVTVSLQNLVAAAKQVWVAFRGAKIYKNLRRNYA